MRLAVMRGGSLPQQWRRSSGGAYVLRIRRPQRELERGSKPRIIVFEDKLAFVEMGDRFREGETEAGAFR